MNIAAVGPYILELYYDPAGARPSAVIEVNKKNSDDEYNKETSIWFNPIGENNPEENAEERIFSDPEQTARDKFRELSQSRHNVEEYL